MIADFEHQHKQVLVKLNNVEIVTIIIQLIFSFSLFSIFFAQSSWLDFHQFSHTIDKNYIFLFCNGLLVFLAKYSGLIRSLSISNRNDEILRACENISMAGSLMVEKEIPLTVTEVLGQRNGSAPDVTTETVYPLLEKDEGGRRIKVLEMAVDGAEEPAAEKPEENVSLNEEEEDDEEEENEGVSAEELNRKFDEFIRRMKEEIRTEAQDEPQLVLISSN